MGNVGDLALNRGDVMRRLAELERQVRELNAGRRLEAATIGQGGMTVKGEGGITLKDGGDLRIEGGGGVDISDGAVRVRNADGQIVAEMGRGSDARYGFQVYDREGRRTARIGELADGSSGIEVIDPVSGKLVELSTLAFGMKGDVISTAEARGDTGTYGDLATPGPTVSNVTIGPSGRCVVFLSTGITVENLRQGYASFNITGATFVPPDDSHSVFAISANISSGGAFLMEGLNPGVHSFQAKYKGPTPGSNAQAIFYDRHLIVMPF